MTWDTLCAVLLIAQTLFISLVFITGLRNLIAKLFIINSTGKNKKNKTSFLQWLVQNCLLNLKHMNLQLGIQVNPLISSLTFETIRHCLLHDVTFKEVNHGVLLLSQIGAFSLTIMACPITILT